MSAYLPFIHMQTETPTGYQVYTWYILRSLSGLCNSNMRRLYEHKGFKQDTILNRKELGRVSSRELADY